MFGNPVEIAVIVGAAVLLFGGSKIRDVARGLGAAQKEFKLGQAEADLAADAVFLAVQPALLAPGDVPLIASHILIPARLFAAELGVVTRSLSCIDLAVGNALVDPALLVVDPVLDLVHARMAGIRLGRLGEGCAGQGQGEASNGDEGFNLK